MINNLQSLFIRYMFSYIIDIYYNMLIRYYLCCLLNTDNQTEIKYNNLNFKLVTPTTRQFKK